MTNKRRKSDAARWANQTIRRRTVLLMGLLGVAVFAALLFKLYDLQIVRHEELQEKDPLCGRGGSLRFIQ